MLRSLLLLVILASPLPAQERSVVCIKLPNGNMRDADQNIIGKAPMAGSGTIIRIDGSQKCPEEQFKDWRLATVLTAWHVVDGEPPYRVVLPGGEDTNLNVIRRGKDIMDDVAVGVCYVPPGYQAIPVVSDDTEFLDRVEAWGLAGKVNKFPHDGLAHRLDGNRIGRQWLDGRAYYDLVVSPGDSGGPILADGKLVGVVQGGLMARLEPSGKYSRVWPLVSVTPSRIREMAK